MMRRFPLVLWCLFWASIEPSNASAQPQDFAVPFPDGEAPDGTKYKTAYRCEGEDLRISCDPGETIQVIRANYGRFSIAICNKNGYTDWSVNCMSHTTTRILQRKCDGESFCDIEVNSGVFGDPCPNTHKYVEVHYACSSQFGGGQGEGGGTTTKKLPPWFLQGPAGSIWTSEADEASSNNGGGGEPSEPPPSRIPQKPAPRKPILVAQDAVKTTTVSTSTTPSPRTSVKYQRVPITTPKMSESGETTTIRAKNDETPPYDASSPNEVAPTYSSGLGDLTTTTDLLYLDNHCAPTLARNLKWNWTRSGDVAIQPCPLGSTGLARWPCDPVTLAFSGPQPDMSDCKSVVITDLESKVREEDPENVIVSSLERLTESEAGPSKLYGGDLEAVVSILKAVLNRLQYLLQTKADSLYNKESFLQEIFQNVLRTGSNLLANQTMPAWMDLSRSRRIKVASNLIQTLEEHALLLLGALEKPEVILESTNEIAVALSVIDSSSSSLEKWTLFPALVEHVGVVNSGKSVNSNKASWGPKWIANLTDAIGISSIVIRAQTKPKLVFSSYANLHKLLADADQQLTSENSSPSELTKNRPMLNSRIISASFFRKPLFSSNDDASEAVAKIRLEHLRPASQTSGAKSICVFWDPHEETWSDVGCQLVNSTESFSDCVCNHLTHFGLLTLSDEFQANLVGNGLDFVGLVQDKKEAQTSTVITLEIATYLVSSICLLILIIILVQFRQQIKRGLQKTPCCKHRIKTASQRDDDVIDKTHHQVYASTVVHNNGHGIQLTLEQTLAPSSGLSGPSTSGSTSSTGTSGSSSGVMDSSKLMTLNMATTRPRPHPQNTMPNWGNNNKSATASKTSSTFKGKLKARLGMRTDNSKCSHQLMEASTTEQDSLLCTLPRTTLPKLAPRHTTPSMQVTVNPYSSSAICDSNMQQDSEYASVVYSSPTMIRRLNRLQYSTLSSRSPQMSRIRQNPPSSTCSPAHRSIMSSTTTLSTCISPRSGRYMMADEVQVNPYSQGPYGYDPNMHHIYCEIPLAASSKERMRNSRPGMRLGNKASTLDDASEFFGEDATQCDLHNISDLSDDEHGQTTTFSELSSMHSSPIRGNFGGGRRGHFMQQGSPKNGSSKKRSGLIRNLAPPPLSCSKNADMSQLPATDV